MLWIRRGFTMVRCKWRLVTCLRMLAGCVLVVMIIKNVISIWKYVSPPTTRSRLRIETRPDSKPTEDELRKLLYGIDLDELKRNQYEKVPPFTYMSEYRNPCWLEHLPRTYMTSYNHSLLNSYGRRQIGLMSAVYDRRLSGQQRPWRLRCLPYFYVAGVTKSGTTDFFFGLSSHRHVLTPWVKEPMYWNRHRYTQGIYVQKHFFARHIEFSHYLNMFDYDAHLINSSRQTRGEFIIGDGSSYLFWEDNGWQTHPGNAKLMEPRYTTMMALHAAQPKAKFIILLREPASRVHSAFVMYTDKKGTAKQFDQLVRKSISEYKACFSRFGVRSCAYNGTLSRRLHPVTLRASMYSVFLRDWLAVYDRDQMLIIKSEDYFADRFKYYNMACTFLSLEPFNYKERDMLEARAISRLQKYEPMFNDTKELLRDFFKPFNDELSAVLNMKLWD